MNRRKFFTRFFGGTAVAAISPELFAKILEQDYTVPVESGHEISVSPQVAFTEGAGIWVFEGRDLLAWSPDANIEMHQEAIETTSRADLPWKTFTAGRLEYTYSSDDLRIDHPERLQVGEVYTVIVRSSNGTIAESGAILTEMGNWGELFPEHTVKNTAKFIGTGELVITHL